MNRSDLEALRTRKRERHYYRLETATSVEYEYQGLERGHPSTYAFVKFECAPAHDLTFVAKTSWPSTLDSKECERFELAIAEGLADTLLDGLYQHSGCALTLTGVRYDEVGSIEFAFMKAAGGAMAQLLNEKWTLVTRGAG